MGSFSYTSPAGSFLCEELISSAVYSEDNPLYWEVCLTSREFLLPIPCWLRFYAGSFSYTSRTGLIFYLVSLTHPMFALFFSGEFLLHIPYWLYFYLGSFSYTSHACFLCGEFLLHILCWLSLMWGETQAYTSRADFIFIWGVSLTHPMLISFFIAGSFSYTSRTGFVSIWGVSLTHPMLALVFCGEFLLHIPC